MIGEAGHYSPMEFAKKAKVSYSTLRRWDETGYLVPKRNAANRRVYTDEDLSRLKVLRGEVPGSGDQVLGWNDAEESYPLLLRRLFEEYLELVAKALEEPDFSGSLSDVVNGAVNCLADGVHRMNQSRPKGLDFDVPVKLVPEEAAELFCLVHQVSKFDTDQFLVQERGGTVVFIPKEKESVYVCRYLRMCGISLTWEHIERFLRMISVLVEEDLVTQEGGDADGLWQEEEDQLGSTAGTAGAEAE